MFYIGFYKGQPSSYIIKFSGGKKKKAGRGISFFYSKRKTSIIDIPAKTIDAYFTFSEITKSFQTVAIQGQLTFCITDFNKVSELLDFSIDIKTKFYRVNDNDRLTDRIVNAVKMSTKDKVKDLTLEETLTVSQSIAKKVLEEVRSGEELSKMGVELLSVHFTSVSPTPEIAKALEADYRENLQKKADEAIYSRRAAAVEQERKIKENEMNSQIELGKKRQILVDIDGNNNVKSAEYNARANELFYGVFKSMDSKTILAMAFKAMGENAAKIGNINITPELLANILQLKDK